MATPSPGKAMNGAEVIIKIALECGIDVCFANPGTTEMHLVGALDTVPGVRPILGMHETVCSGAADGYARMARRPAMTLLHLGPGLANALANLHNARRAGSPILNLVGDMAGWHRHAESNLKMDIEGLAKTVSRWVRTSESGDSIATDTIEAVAATYPGHGAKGGVNGRVSTLIVPHDIQWSEMDVLHNVSTRFSSLTERTDEARKTSLQKPAAKEFIRGCAEALCRAKTGKAALLLGGCALLDEALLCAGQLASMVGAALLCENSPSRIDRGRHLPCPKRLPYFPKEALKELSQFDTIVVMDMRKPVAMFGYEDMESKSELIELPDDSVWEFDDTTNIPEALRLITLEVQACTRTPNNTSHTRAAPAMPKLPTGSFNARALCGIIAALQPEGSIVVDESLTSGNGYWEMSEASPSFSHLTLTGGAIGMGPPASVGAAVACPKRQVINFQADGSGLYSLQALWTQAREGLKVITVICANNAYNILKIEMAMQLAAGFGVPAVRVETCEDMIAEFRKALLHDGPFLIEAAI